MYIPAPKWLICKVYRSVDLTNFNHVGFLDDNMGWSIKLNVKNYTNEEEDIQ